MDPLLDSKRTLRTWLRERLGTVLGIGLVSAIMGGYSQGGVGSAWDAAKDYAAHYVTYLSQTYICANYTPEQRQKWYEDHAKFTVEQDGLEWRIVTGCGTKPEEP